MRFRFKDIGSITDAICRLRRRAKKWFLARVIALASCKPATIRQDFRVALAVTLIANSFQSLRRGVAIAPSCVEIAALVACAIFGTSVHANQFAVIGDFGSDSSDELAVASRLNMYAPDF